VACSVLVNYRRQNHAHILFTAARRLLHRGGGHAGSAAPGLAQPTAPAHLAANSVRRWMGLRDAGWTCTGSRKRVTGVSHRCGDVQLPALALRRCFCTWDVYNYNAHRAFCRPPLARCCVGLTLKTSVQAFGCYAVLPLFGNISSSLCCVFFLPAFSERDAVGMDFLLPAHGMYAACCVCCYVL